jgi:hypothetical protein
MAPVFPTQGARLDFLIITLRGLQQTISAVADYHNWNSLEHIAQTMRRITEIVKREIVVILEYWMPFFHNSSGPLSVQAMKVHSSLLNILTVKDKIADTPINHDNVALLLIEYNKLNTLISTALGEFAILNEVLVASTIEPVIVGPPLLRRQPNIGTTTPLFVGDQMNQLDMALGKNYFKRRNKTHRKRHRKRDNIRSSKSKIHYKLRKPKK